MEGEGGERGRRVSGWLGMVYVGLREERRGWGWGWGGRGEGRRGEGRGEGEGSEGEGEAKNCGFMPIPNTSQTTTHHY